MDNIETDTITSFLSLINLPTNGDILHPVLGEAILTCDLLYIYYYYII